MFDFLTKSVSEYQFGNKEIYITERNTITVATETFGHLHAYTRMIIHLLDGTEKGMQEISLFARQAAILL